jgi:hypothetical protein
MQILTAKITYTPPLILTEGRIPPSQFYKLETRVHRRDKHCYNAHFLPRQRNDD